jgi:flagellar biosynthesis/type III secretory pathway chaperone
VSIIVLNNQLQQAKFINGPLMDKKDYFLQRALEYLAGSIFYSAHPPTPSAIPITLSVKRAASSPPLCLF